MMRMRYNDTRGTTVVKVQVRRAQEMVNEDSASWKLLETAGQGFSYAYEMVAR